VPGLSTRSAQTAGFAGNDANTKGRSLVLLCDGPRRMQESVVDCNSKSGIILKVTVMHRETTEESRNCVYKSEKESLKGEVSKSLEEFENYDSLLFIVPLRVSPLINQGSCCTQPPFRDMTKRKTSSSRKTMWSSVHYAVTWHGRGSEEAVSLTCYTPGNG